MVAAPVCRSPPDEEVAVSTLLVTESHTWTHPKSLVSIFRGRRLASIIKQLRVVDGRDSGNRMGCDSTDSLCLLAFAAFDHLSEHDDELGC